MRGPKCPSQARMDNKIVIITGANSGIGFETAKNLVFRGKCNSEVNIRSVLCNRVLCVVLFAAFNICCNC